jgi:16S rRNA (cytidine1402-2'-O)-methyltransferase
MTAPGILVLVATPIGNLGDLSPRAADALGSADVICCEDTRRTGRLLELAGIGRRRPLLRIDDHTEAARISDVLRRLAAGERVVVVSDAGTPGISDPGERLVRAAVGAGYVVEVVPGPSAAVAALVASGLPTGRFVFEGFLPRRGSGREARLVALAVEPRTIVVYESPHRLAQTLADLAVGLGNDRRVAVARELTKLHEEVWRGSLADAAQWAAQERPRGELVLVIDGAPQAAPVRDEDVAVAVQEALASGLSARDAATEVARELGVAKRRAYAVAVGSRAGRDTADR